MDAGRAPGPRTDPVRPGAGLTPDGRPRAEVRSYARRGSRLTPAQQAAWERGADRWLIPADQVTADQVTADQVTADPPFLQDRWFGSAGHRAAGRAPLAVEIGSGTGEVATTVAAARPAYDVLAIEVWRPGVAATLRNLERAGVENVRVIALDASWVLQELLPPASVTELWTLFPDPWPKQRHHKRRLVGPEFATLATSRLTPGGSWRLATDWDDYAAAMRQLLDAQPLLAGGVVQRWAERPLTKFERRGLREGRAITDLCYTRR